MGLIVKQHAPHYQWGDNCDGWHLVKTDALSVIQENMPPGTEETLHFHTNAQQFFFILNGTATFEKNGAYVDVGERQGFYIQPGEHHRIFNKTDHDLEFIVISQPMAHGDRTSVFE
ncbi:MAG TPA: cupin domain-containing protein [Parapedobacter sp.]|uniref:cupin domain-containing protein n=1 Tax=Parapedobacter sp. TaxID=1958893 RepID=UPI002CE2C6C6|nr:cupin domain-containing protein [Parapedobacter sp.]HWK56195.1 cupin domain-containing protein [Parapedobacter sp.]